MPTISTVSPILMTPLLDPSGRHRAAAGDREDVLDRHQERLVQVADRLGDVGVERLGELEDLALVLLVALERLQRGADDERNVVAWELVLGQQVADLDLDELEQLGVVDHVRLIEEHDDVRHADLTSEQDVLTRLRHRAVGGGHDQDRAVHLGGTGDHVLDVVGVTGAVDVGVMTVRGLVLDVRGRDRYPAGLLLGRVVDRVEGPHLGAVPVLIVEHLGDGRGQRRLAMVDVTDGADVHMGLVTLEVGLRHCGSSLLAFSQFRSPKVDEPIQGISFLSGTAARQPGCNRVRRLPADRPAMLEGTSS